MVKKNQPLINLTITPREKDLGGFSVRRILPYVEQKMVGPFIFLDHMGPADFAAGQGMDVRPHPHIGLATVTYLFEGEMFHRDSMGSAQEILPGAVNWMTSGHGITHSERTGEQVRKTASRAHGLQSWVALPKEFEEIAPEFYHHAANTLPMFDMRGVQLKLVAGRAYGNQSPVKIYSPLFYVEAKMPAGTSLVLPNEYMERALYLIGISSRAPKSGWNKPNLIGRQGNSPKYQAMTANSFHCRNSEVKRIPSLSRLP